MSTSLRESMANWLLRGEHSQQSQLLGDGIAALREASYEIERAREDANWTMLSGDQQAGQGVDRAKAVPMARWAFTGGCAFTKAAVLNKTHFCFGNGVDGPSGDESPALDALRGMWDEPSNQSAMFGTSRQYERSNQLLCDGDLFLTLHQLPGDDILRVRRFAPLRVRQIICDPEDPSRPLYYAVSWQRMAFDATAGTQGYDGSAEVRYYQDWQNRNPGDDPYYGRIPADKLMPALMMHTALNRINERGFGTSDVAASLKWFMASKRIAEDQATISAATAVFMNQLTVQGNASQIDAVASAFKAQVEAATEDRTNNGAAYGAVNVMPPGMDMKVNRSSSQAGDAWQNSRMMRVAGVAGMGQGLHYLGDPENANLATTKSIELPILTGFIAYQAIWKDIYRNLCDMQLVLRGIDPRAEEAQYDIPVPRIIEPDLADLCGAINEAADAGRITEGQASRRLLAVFGSDDPYREMQEIEDARGEQVQEQAASSVQALQFEPGMDDEGDAEDAEGAAV